MKMLPPNIRDFKVYRARESAYAADIPRYRAGRIRSDKFVNVKLELIDKVAGNVITRLCDPERSVEEYVWMFAYCNPSFDEIVQKISDGHVMTFNCFQFSHDEWIYLPPLS